MVGSFDFDEIRPYSDSEANTVLKRLVIDPSFINFVNYLFPDQPENILKDKIKDIHAVNVFQKNIMYPAAKRIVERTIDQLTHSGFDQLERGKTYLFISNHRDIILDSALLNLILFEYDLDTVEVAIGSNLLISPWITDLVKLNKNFVVHRDVPHRELYHYSKRLSTYIRQKITSKTSSVWIAQKEGRTKDGNDRTQAGLLKMFTISSDKEFVENLNELNIIPLSISYEYEPCDVLKAYELHKQITDVDYKKSPQDDLNSMFTGVTSHKGRVHFALGKQMNKADFESVKGIINKNEQIKRLAHLIDTQIFQNYKLWPSNYIAADMLKQSNQRSQNYSEDDRKNFSAYLDSVLEKYPELMESLRKIILKIYANPVFNKESCL